MRVLQNRGAGISILDGRRCAARSFARGLAPVALHSRTFASAAAELPPVTLDEGSADAPEPTYNHKEAHVLAATVAAKLPLNTYSVVFDAIDETDRASIMTTLDDDRGDIYADLKDSLELLDAGPSAHAVWQCRFSYYSHWGMHLSHAQTAVFSWLADSGHFYE